MSGVAAAAGFAFGLGLGAGVAGRAEFRSTTFDKVPIAFSRIGSTSCKIFNLLSKS